MSDDTYKTRSRCSKCSEFAIEGEAHECPVVGGDTKKHTNPAAPKEPKGKKK